MPRVLLLMPTKTYRASAFLQAASRLGFDAVVSSERKQALATFTPGKTVTVAFNDQHKACRDIVEFSRKYPFDAIVPVDDDTAWLAALASEALRLKFNPPAAVQAAREKHTMRRRLAESGQRVPNFQVFSTEEALDSVEQSIPYPCVLKPVFLSASRGVIRANNREEFFAAFERIAALLRQHEIANRGGALANLVLVEDYIPGEEVALEGILTEGELKLLALFDKPDPMEGPYFAETIYVTPSRRPSEMQQRVLESVAEATKTLGLRTGPVHAELRIDGDEPWILEIAARSIGGLCARSLRFANGISLEELILRHAVGQDIQSIEREELASGVMMIPIPKAGLLHKVRGLDKANAGADIEEIRITIPLGQSLAPLPEGDRYLGFIFARAETPERVEKAIRKAFSCIELDIAEG